MRRNLRKPFAGGKASGGWTRFMSKLGTGGESAAAMGSQSLGWTPAGRVPRGPQELSAQGHTGGLGSGGPRKRFASPAIDSLEFREPQRDRAAPLLSALRRQLVLAGAPWPWTGGRVRCSHVSAA